MTGTEDLVRHMEWADATLWGIVLADDGAPRDPRVETWLHHVHEVHHAFLGVWRGKAFRPSDPRDFDGPVAIARWGRDAHAQIGVHLGTVNDAAWDSELEIPWAEELTEEWGGPIGPVTLRQSVLQLALHTAHHRGQVTARLRELGCEPPLIDFIAWLWRNRPPVMWPALVDGGRPGS